MPDTLKQDLLADLQQLLAKNGKVTRDFYRENGKYSEKAWSQFFPSFKDFLAAAGYQEEPSETHDISGDHWNINLKSTIHTLPELLEYCQVDLGVWDVERFIANKWDMGYVVGVGDDKEARSHALYQIKATLVRRKELVDARAEIEKLKEEFKKSAPIRERLTIPTLPTGNMLEVNVSDAHFGKMAWARETGHQNYDTPIAAATFMRAVRTIVGRSIHYKFDKIVFVVGNDLLNSDNEQGTTTKGTFVSTDGRYQKVFLTVRKTITEAIELLRQIAPVEVVMVSGNHDDLGVWHLGDSLECLYANTDDVTINNEPTARKYVRFGDVFLMFTHGDKGKRDDYPLLMATERSRDFGETKFREIHTGHIHQTKLQEWHGVRVRILPSLSPPDAWHAENAFTGQQRNAEGYIWNHKEGLLSIVFHNDDAYPAITTDRVLKEG